MKVYVAVDTSGISGAIYPPSADPGEYPQPELIELTTLDTNAAVEGAFAAGATEVIVNDCAGPGRFIDPIKLDKRAKLLGGSYKYMQMVDMLDDTFDAAILVGQHARAGTYNSMVDHTYCNEVVECRVNGKPIGEIGWICLMAGSYNVPVCLVTGDKAGMEEAIDLLGNVETYITKEGSGRYSALCIHPEVSAANIRKKTEKALKELKEYEPLKFKPPYTLEMDLYTSMIAMFCTYMPGVKQIEPRTVSFTSNDMADLYKVFLSTCFTGWKVMEYFGF